jgi:sarcosine oxidase
MYDTIVIGLGGMGSATAWHLARRGQRVLGLEQYLFDHDRGSSHGESRIIRHAYFEHPDYVPLLKRSYAYWNQLDGETGREIITLCGMFMAGRADDTVISGTRRAAAEHGLPLEQVAPSDALERFPNLRAEPGMDILFDPLGGYLCVENCVAAHLDGARVAGATLRQNEEVLSWKAEGGGVRVTTVKGEYTATSLVISAGPWAAALLRDLNLPLAPHRVAMAWFQPETAIHDVDQGAPVFGMQTEGGFFYGFPCIGREGVKVALHLPGTFLEDPAKVDRQVSEEDVGALRAFAESHLVDLCLDPWTGKTCIYTMTPDEHFIVDRHPHHENVFIAAGFSGHGFKFAPVIGSIMADYCINGTTSEPADFLGLARFRGA